MAEEIAARITQAGPVRVFDVQQTAKGRSMHSTYVHDGFYYLLPPPGTTASELEAQLDEFKANGDIHFSFNSQSVIDVPHKPIIPLDAFAHQFFGAPKTGVIKITAVSRSKVTELHALIDAMKPSFDPKTFPYVNELERTDYKPRTSESTARLTLRFKGSGWKHMRDVEEAIRLQLAEDNYIRDLTVGRHSVRGFEPEILLTTNEETTEKGFAYLSALAEHLPGAVEGAVAVESNAHDLLSVLSAAGNLEAEGHKRRPREPVVQAMSPLELRRAALAALRDTLDRMESFRTLTKAVIGNTLQVQFPKGILGLGGHFDDEAEATLGSVFRTVQTNPQFRSGWTAHYHYDRASRLLSISATGEGETGPHGWSTLY